MNDSRDSVTSRLYEVWGFTEGRPHWDTAIIEATSPDEAKAILKAHLDAKKAEDNLPDTIWGWDEDEDTSQWIVREASGPVVFVMGSGCR